MRRATFGMSHRNQALVGPALLILAAILGPGPARASLEADLETTRAPSAAREGEAGESLEALRARLGYVWHSIQAPVSGIQAVVHYLPGDEAWAQATLQTTLTAIPALERITGVPLPIRYDVHLWEVHEADIGLAGKNAREDGILLSREQADQEVVVHELAHYWVGSHNLAEHWMAEGLAELYNHLVRLQMQGRHWMPPVLPELRSLHPFDAPLALWERLDRADATVQQREVNRFFYSKAFLFWYGLHRACGPGFVRDLQRWIQTGREPRDSTALLAFLEATQRRGAPSAWDMFPGWLVGGTYTSHGQPRSFEWYLSDEDDDGVSNYEESLASLDPSAKDSDGDGMDDGWELATGRNPARAEPRRGGPSSAWVIPQWTPSSSRRFVRVGETIKVTAEGWWRMADHTGRWFEPDGMWDGDGRDGQWGELLAQVGLGPNAGRVHRIGRGATFVADRDGILYFFARGSHKRMGRGGLLVATEGGRLLPNLTADDRRHQATGRLMNEMRAEGVTELELSGRHVTLVLSPTDVQEMVSPASTLAYLDQVYETYREMLGEAPYGGRRITITFDVTTRDQIFFHGNSLVLTFGLDHLRAVQKVMHPSRSTWGLTYAMAMPFLEWFQVERLLEGKGVWALAELMATQLYESHGAEIPALEQARARLRSYRITLRGPETLKGDKRLTWTFMNTLRRDFGWRAFRAMLEANGTLRQLPAELTVSDVPFEEFLLAFARAAGVNLGERYKAWGFPITGRLRQALEPLPMPEADALPPPPPARHHG